MYEQRFLEKEKQLDIEKEAILKEIDSILREMKERHENRTALLLTVKRLILLDSERLETKVLGVDQWVKDIYAKEISNVRARERRVEDLDKRLSECADKGAEAHERQDKQIANIEARIKELDEQLIKLHEERLSFSEEVRSRLTRLENASFMGEFTRLLEESRRRGVDPTRLLKEALEILKDS